MPFHFHFTHTYNPETFFLNPDNLTARDSYNRTALVQAATNQQFVIVNDILEKQPHETNQNIYKDIYGHVPAFNELLKLAYNHRDDRHSSYKHPNDKIILEAVLPLMKTILRGDISSYSTVWCPINRYYISPFGAIIRIKDPELLALYIKTTAKNKFTDSEPFRTLNNALTKKMVSTIVENFPATNFDQRSIYRDKLERILNNYNDDRDQDLALLLIKQGAFLHFKAKSHSTPLHWAIIEKKNDFIRAMITSPVCPWDAKSPHLKFKLTPLDLAKQLAPHGQTNIISTLIENKPVFLDNLLTENSNVVTKTFATVLLEEVEKEDFQLDQDFYQGLIHRLLQTSPLPLTNSKIITKLLESKKFDIESKFNEETPLQAVMNDNELLDLRTLVFLMKSGANMEVTNKHGQTVVQQILFSDYELTADMKKFMHALVVKYPHFTQVEGSPLFKQLTTDRLSTVNTALFTFGLHVRAHIQAVLTPNSSVQYNNNFFSNLLLDSSSATPLSKVENFSKYRKEALKVLTDIVLEYKEHPNASELQQSPILALLHKMLKNPLFTTHGKIGALTSSIYKRENTSAIGEIQKLIAQCEGQKNKHILQLTA